VVGAAQSSVGAGGAGQGGAVASSGSAEASTGSGNGNCDGSCDNPCPNQPCVPGPAPSSLPSQEWIGDFVIAGFEYWPYANGTPNYPDDILWNYPEGTAPARACMAASRKRLKEILQNPPMELVQLKQAYGTQGTYAFYNWNNDYTGASGNGLAYWTTLWMWEESFIKWVSETNTDGTCNIPTKDDLIQLASTCMTQYPNCALPQ
jgi:hypothetical protein